MLRVRQPPRFRLCSYQNNTHLQKMFANTKTLVLYCNRYIIHRESCEKINISKGTAMQGDPVDEFIDKLIKEKNLTSLDDEMRSRVASELKELVMSNINKAIVQQIPEEKAKELTELLDDEGTTEEQLQGFVEANVDVAKITAMELARFRNAYLGVG